MGTYVSGAHGEDLRRVDRAIDRALRVMRQHQPNPATGICQACGGVQGCRKREAAVAIFSTYMSDPAFVRPYIKA
jgi:hypothetical protein